MGLLNYSAQQLMTARPLVAWLVQELMVKLHDRSTFGRLASPRINV